MPLDQKRITRDGQTKLTLIIVAIGIVALALFLLVDSTSWLHLKPASGTANAMSLASDTNGAATPPATR